MKDEQEEKRTRSGVRRILMWAVPAALAAALVVAAGGFWLLRTDSGRGRLETFVERVASSEGFELTIDGLAGDLPGEAVFDRIAVADDEGTWLEVEDLEIGIRLLPLLKDVWYFKTVRARKVVLDRLPRKSGAREEPDEIEVEFEPPRAVVDSLELERVEVGKDAFGRAALLEVFSELRASERSYTVEARAKRLDRPSDELTVSAEASRDFSSLDLNATLTEDAGGLVGAMLDFPENAGMRAELSGKGSVSDFSGSLSAEAPGVGGVEAQYSLTGDTARTLDAKGRLETTPDMQSSALHRLVGGKADFDFRVTRRPEGLLEIASIDVAGAGVELTVRDGSFDPDGGAVSGNMRVNVIDHAALADLAGMDALRTEGVELKISGDPGKLDVRVDAKIAEAAFGGVGTVDAVLGADCVVRRALSGRPGISAAGKFESPRIDLPYGNATLTAARIDFDASTERFERLKAKRLDVVADGVEVESSGTMLLDASDIDADVKAVLSDPGRYIPELYGIGAEGVELSAHVTGSPRDAVLGAETRGAVKRPTGVPEAAAGLVGDEVRFTGRVGYADGAITARGLEVESDSAFLDVSGQVEPGRREFEANWVLKVRDPDWIKDYLGLGLAGRPTVSGAASGTFKDFKIEIKAVTDGVLFGGEAFEDFEAVAEASGMPGRNTADLSVLAEWRGRRVSLKTTVGYAGDRVEFEDVSVAAPQFRAGGNVTLLLENGFATGKLRGRIDRLSEYSDLLGDAYGAADFTLRAGAEGGRRLDAEVQVHSAGYGAVSAEAAEISLRIKDVFGDASGTASSELRNTRLGPALIDTARLTAEGGPRSARADFSIAGGAGEPFDLVGLVVVECDDGIVLRFERLEGEFAGIGAESVNGAVFAVSDDGLALRGLALDVGTGAVTASGSIEQGHADLRAEVRGVDLKVLESFYPIPVSGLLDARISASGPPGGPGVEFAVVLSELLPVDASEAEPARAEISGELEAGRLTADAKLESGGESMFTARAEAPVSFALAPWSLHIPGQGRLSGRAEGVLDLAAARLFLDMEDQYVAGRAQLSAKLDGVVSDPRVSGRLELDRARYEHLGLGAVLEDLTGEAELADGKVLIREIRARVGGSGKIYAKGRVDLDAEKGFPYEFELEPGKAAVVNTERIEAVVHGSLELAGNMERGNLAGDLTIDPAHIRLPEKTPPEVVQVDVTRVNAPPGEIPETRPDGGYMLGLDVAVNIPARFFVRGRGLHAEFRGDLEVEGEADDPDVKGTISVVRGHYMFLDRRLTLEQGALSFTGRGLMPILDVVAETESAGAVAKIRLSGPADNFTLDLSSDPPMPENEIMARLLFGRKAVDLNPMQAVQLANALARFSGGGGEGVLGKAERALGLSRLQVKGGEGGEAPVVGVGKYVRENVYLEVDRDFTTGGEEVSVEVEVTPKVGVTGSASQYKGGELGVHWKLNY